MLPVTSADLVFGAVHRNDPHVPDRQGETGREPRCEDADSEDTLRNGSTSAFGKGSTSILDDPTLPGDPQSSRRSDNDCCDSR